MGTSVVWAKDLHEERLRTLMECPSLFDGEPVKNYNRKHICVICDAESDSRETLPHNKPNCVIEFKQIMLFAWYLQRHAA